MKQLAVMMLLVTNLTVKFQCAIAQSNRNDSSNDLTIRVESLKNKVDGLRNDSTRIANEIYKLSSQRQDLNQSITSTKSKLQVDSVELITRKSISDTISRTISLLQADSTELVSQKNGIQIIIDSTRHYLDSLRTNVNEGSEQMNKIISRITLLGDSLNLIATVKLKPLVTVHRGYHKKEWVCKKIIRAALDDDNKPGYQVVKRPFIGKKWKVYSDYGKNRKPPLPKVVIRRVYLKVREGMLIEVRAETDSGTFRNENFVADLLHYSSYGTGSKRLHRVNEDYHRGSDDEYIYLDDVFRYHPQGASTTACYNNFDINLLNDSAHQTEYITESTSLNTYFNVSAFTDIAGLGGEANGLVQFVADAKFITNTRGFGYHATVPFHSISFTGSLSKFDKSFRGTPAISRNSDGQDSISRRDLLQRAIFRVGVKVNLLHGFESPYPWHLISDWQLNAGYSFSGSGVLDTTFKDAARTIIDTNFRTVIQNEIYLEPTISFTRGGNFSLSLSAPFYMVSVKKSANILNNAIEPWEAPGIRLSYNSKRDNGSKLFLRYNQYINLNNPTQAFYQIQLGATVNIVDLLNKKGGF